MSQSKSVCLELLFFKQETSVSEPVAARALPRGGDVPDMEYRVLIWQGWTPSPRTSSLSLFGCLNLSPQQIKEFSCSFSAAGGVSRRCSESNV